MLFAFTNIFFLSAIYVYIKFDNVSKGNERLASLGSIQQSANEDKSAFKKKKKKKEKKNKAKLGINNLRFVTKTCHESDR